MSLGHVFSSVAVAGVLLIGYAAHAQEAVLGKNEFEARCSVCHGVTGAGDGLVGELFAQKPKNLRVLAKENGGIFPFDEVRAAIDGRRRVIAHGSSEMPIWGDYLMARRALANAQSSSKSARPPQGRTAGCDHLISLK